MPKRTVVKAKRLSANAMEAHAQGETGRERRGRRKGVSKGPVSERASANASSRRRDGCIRHQLAHPQPGLRQLLARESESSSK